MAKRRNRLMCWWAGCAWAIGGSALVAGEPQPTALPARHATMSAAAEPVVVLPPFHLTLPASAREPGGELSVDDVVGRVLSRNPTVAQMVAAWQAAAARYPQVRSLEDPMVSGTIGPATFNSRDVDFAYRLEVSQRLPYPGKRALRGESALAEAAAVGSEVELVRQQLAEAARGAVYDYYLAQRGLEVNREALQLLRDARQNAEARYKTGQAPQQDVLRADVEIGRQRERTLTLERAQRVAIARLNTLMHLPPDTPLPPPPKQLPLGPGLPDPKALRERALAQRPELLAVQHRMAAERAALALAQKEYKPDFEIVAAYDTFWQPPEEDLRPSIGLRLNLPFQRERRSAAVAEAEARLAQRIAEFHRLVDQVNYEVHQAVEQLRESEQAVRLYEVTVLPAAVRSVKEAQGAYITAKVPFLTLIEAQRGLVELRDRFYEMSVEYLRRRAALERVLGNSIPEPARAEPTQPEPVPVRPGR